MWLAILQAMKNKQLLTPKPFCQTEKNNQKTFLSFYQAATFFYCTNFNILLKMYHNQMISFFFIIPKPAVRSQSSLWVQFAS